MYKKCQRLCNYIILKYKKGEHLYIVGGGWLLKRDKL